MMYLLDTNVISELRKAGTPGKCDSNVLAWAQSVSPSSLFLSAISMLEIEIGILLMERKDAEQGARLRAWLESSVLPAFLDRILPVDLPVVQCCAALHVPNPMSDRDALIAATAITHGMTVVTRNVSDFPNHGLRILNPWLPAAVLA